MTASSGVSKIIQRSVRGLLRREIKSFSTQIPTREFEEIKFKVPWGHVAGKWYGPKDKRPIVGFHGIQDSAGSFDRLAPLLPPQHSFLALDLPGNGYSSRLPDGMMYHTVDYMKFMLIVMEEFKWDKISMICHSMSGLNGFMFCSLFPDKCDLYIGLDNLKLLSRPLDDVVNRMIKRIGEFRKCDEMNHKAERAYDYDELINKIYEGSEGSLQREVCPIFLKRNIKPTPHDPTKFYFTLDHRLRSTLYLDLPEHVIVDLAKRISCPYLFIKGMQSIYYEDKKHYDKVLNILKEQPTFEYHEVDGTHHVHLNEPEKVAKIINPFIMKWRPE